jgi:hypothetical protein
VWHARFSGSHRLKTASLRHRATGRWWPCWRKAAQVDAAHAAGLAAGGTDAGAPGLRPQDHANFYGAYLRDPDDTKIGLACHAPGP